MKRNLKIRYYLRGLGLGTAVTALVLGLSAKQGGQMTDEEIKAKAAALGMVETQQAADNSVSTPVSSEAPASTEKEESSVVPESSESSEEVIESSGSSEEVIESSESSEESVESSESSEESVESSESSEEVIESSTSSEETDPVESSEQPVVDDGQQGGNSDIYTLTVTKGMSSSKVAAVLQEAGLVSDAKAYDKYLCRNGYDKSISVGTFQIPYGSSEEEIAKIIAKKK